jgi:hypothetical protein
MKIHHYDRETGAFLGSSDAAPDPLEHRALVETARIAAQAAKDARTKDLRKRTPLTDAEFVPPAPVKFLIPAFATAIAPPTVPKGKEAIFANGAWTLREKETA